MIILQVMQLERVIHVHHSQKPQHRSPKSNERKSTSEHFDDHSRDGATISNIPLAFPVTAAALVCILTLRLVKTPFYVTVANVVE